MKEELVINTARCKSCGLCVSTCPRGALYIGEELNAAGYKCVAVDQSKCVTCGMCYAVCPDYVLTIEEVRV